MGSLHAGQPWRTVVHIADSVGPRGGVVEGWRPTADPVAEAFYPRDNR